MNTKVLLAIVAIPNDEVVSFYKDGTYSTPRLIGSGNWLRSEWKWENDMVYYKHVFDGVIPYESRPSSDVWFVWLEPLITNAVKRALDNIEVDKLLLEEINGNL